MQTNNKLKIAFVLVFVAGALVGEGIGAREQYNLDADFIEMHAVSGMVFETHGHTGYYAVQKVDLPSLNATQEQALEQVINIMRK